MENTKEQQYQFLLELENEGGLTSLGLMTNAIWHTDPRRLLFLLSRYKFVAKMVTGKKRVLEVGCGDAFGSVLVKQEIPHLTAVDFDPSFVKDIKARMNPKWPIECKVHDILSGPIEGELFDAAYSLDVLEHIEKESEDIYMKNVHASLNQNGVIILGMPSIHSQAYASKTSKEGHVNCKNADEFRQLVEKYFHNVFLFSMNDEVLHTGFSPMSHYFFAMGVGKK
jgi:cyclopropane fatty-acyl-phospholipid synthase-like methyltransferase